MQFIGRSDLARINRENLPSNPKVYQCHQQAPRSSFGKQTDTSAHTQADLPKPP